MRIKVGKFTDFEDEIPLSYSKPCGDSFSLYYTDNNHGLIAICRCYPIDELNIEIADFWVDEKYRGQKVPKKEVKWSNMLLKSAIGICKRRKYQNIYLWVTEDNIPAVKLYKIFGFEHNYNFISNRFNFYKIKKKHQWLKNKKIIVMAKKNI